MRALCFAILITCAALVSCERPVGPETWPATKQTVPSGYAMIPQARQIDDLFGPAWHSCSNYRHPDTVEWISEAYFAKRYQLVMVVRAKVERPSGKVIEVVDEPRFILMKIEEVTGGGGTSYDGASQREFGANEWAKVVKAKGDFGVIGIELNYNDPVPGFEGLIAHPRNGVQMSEKMK